MTHADMALEETSTPEIPSLALAKDGSGEESQPTNGSTNPSCNITREAIPIQGGESALQQAPTEEKGV